jgi:hypothetical protein
MGNLGEVIDEMMKIDGTLGAAILDLESGMPLAANGNGVFDMDVTSAGALDVVRAWNKAAGQTDRRDGVENVVGIYPETIAFVRCLDGRNDGLAMMLLLERKNANQALANHHLKRLSEQIQL